MYLKTLWRSFIRFNTGHIVQRARISSHQVLVGTIPWVAGVQRSFLFCTNFQQFCSIVQAEHLHLAPTTSNYCVFWVMAEWSTEQKCIRCLNQKLLTSFSSSQRNWRASFCALQSHNCNWSVPLWAPVKTWSPLMSTESPEILGPHIVAIEFPSLISQTLI